MLAFQNQIFKSGLAQHPRKLPRWINSIAQGPETPTFVPASRLLIQIRQGSSLIHSDRVSRNPDQPARYIIRVRFVSFLLFLPAVKLTTQQSSLLKRLPVASQVAGSTSRSPGEAVPEARSLFNRPLGVSDRRRFAVSSILFFHSGHFPLHNIALRTSVINSMFVLEGKMSEEHLGRRRLAEKAIPPVSPFFARI